MNEIETYTLDNGLRIVCAPSPTEVVYCGIAVDAGTRHELPSEEGIAHFTEHLTFKGTSRRKAWHILNRMETVGGDLNAFTGKEETVYYCTFLKQHFVRAIDLLLDVVLHSTYPQHEMDKEVEVVIDEIESYRDSPSELIYDDFENLLFKGHPLGHNILGEAEGLRRMKTEDIQRFVRRLYTPDRMVLFVQGNIPLKTIVREVKKGVQSPTPSPLAPLPSSLVPSPSPLVPSQNEGGDHAGRLSAVDVSEQPGASRFVTDSEPAFSVTLEKETHQAHVMMGRRAFSASDPRYLHLYLMNNMLGGPGMNSRLNLALRERNGLVYTVESSLTPYTDTGVWCVYFGCDSHDVPRCRRLVMRELQRFVDAPLTASQLEAAKRQIIGQIGISYDAFESVAIGMGKRMLHYNTTRNCQQLIDSIQALTADGLYATAREFFVPESICSLVYQ